MAGNSFGSLFKITTFGESHGLAVGVLIDGVKPRIPISESELQRELDRRRPGQSRITTPRQEIDKVQILSGIFEGKTLGTPVCMLIWNKDQDPKAYEKLKNIFRPGHAGYTYLTKFGIQDYRGGGRASGRETAGRVAAGALAKKILSVAGIKITAYTKQIGKIIMHNIDLDEIENNSVRCPDPVAAKRMEKEILKAQRSGDSLGGIIEAVVKNCPAGLGDPVFDKLEADLAKALMSVPAIRGFEVGSGFASAIMKGSENNDEFFREKKTGRVRTKTNFAGGILGGISNGEDIVVRVAVKPTSSIAKQQETIDTKGKRRLIMITGRHDPCICPRIVPVVESMIALVIADHLMRQELIRKPNPITRIREGIDIVDDSITILLSKRQEMAQEVGVWKRKRRLPYYNPEREEEILNKRLALIQESNLDPKFVNKIFKTIIEHACEIQKIP